MSCDRLGSKADACEFFGVTYQTLGAWIRNGMPVVTRGSKGVEWRIDLLEAAQWRFGGGGAYDKKDPDSMPPKERLDWIRGNREMVKYRQEIGELIPSDVHRVELAAVIKVIATALDTLMDVLERDAGLNAEAIERGQAVIDGYRESLYHQLIELKEQE